MNTVEYSKCSTDMGLAGNNYGSCKGGTRVCVVAMSS